MNVDVVQLVKESLEKMGCGSAISGELEQNSSICIAFQSLPSMYVERDDEHVTLWSRLDYEGESQLARAAVDLLNYRMSTASDVFAGRQPILLMVEDVPHLYGRIEEAYLSDSDMFIQALEAFYEDLCAISEILAR